MDLYKDTTHQKGGMKVSKVETMGWKNAILGMRYPLNSEAMSDTYVDESGRVVVGEKDKDLIVRLSVAGSAHRKVLRMIHIQMSVKMPMTWWKHEATHKVGVTEISRSTMHKGVGKETLTKDDFYVEEWNKENEYVLGKLVELQGLHAGETDPKAKKALWRRLIDALPMSYCQERMVDMNYEVAISMLHLRYQVEKLSPEWDFFCQALLYECPLLREIYDATRKNRQLTTEEFDALPRGAKPAEGTV